MKYEYDISMKWTNTDDKGAVDTFDISPENIVMLSMDNNYEEALMPVMYARLSIDKKDMDKMVQHAKTATIVMTLSKMKAEKDSTDGAEKGKAITPYSGEMSYFIDKDINYNTDIDYAGFNKDTSDKLETFAIGLMFKECITANKQTNNTTFINTDPFNAILSFIKSTPLLVEKFDHNEPIPQLIVPPQESLYKTVEFFNNTAVFYNTDYRFYIEPGCIYLQSTSGNPVQKSSEPATDVLFDIKAIDDETSEIEGLMFDDEKKLYMATLNVKDTVYRIDNNTTKLYNQIATILDPSKNNTIVMLDQVNEAMNKIKKTVNSIKSTIVDKAKQMAGIPSDTYDQECKLKDCAMQAQSVADKCTSEVTKGINIVKAIPENTGSDGATNQYVLSAADKKMYLEKLDKKFKELEEAKKSIPKVPEEFGKNKQLLTQAMAKLTGLGGLLGGVSPINAPDNIDATKKELDQTKETIAKQEKELTTIVQKEVEAQAKIVDINQEINNIFNEISKSYIASESSGSVLDPLGLVVGNVRGYNEEFSEVVEKVNKEIAEYKAKNSQVKEAVEAVEPKVQSMDSFKKDLKSNIIGQVKDLRSGLLEDIRSIGATARKTLDQMKSSVSDIVNSVKSLDFSIDSLDDIQKDINTVKDLSKIGRLGISSFNAYLDISEGRHKSGTMIVRVENDNVNMVKNIKSRIENNTRRLTLNKNGLDTTVITPNKRYIVHNYDAHSNKDGVFILNRKVDIFTRHGGKFAVNTRIQLSKVQVESNQKTANEKSFKKLVKGDWKDIVASSKSIIEKEMGNNIPLHNLTELMNYSLKIDKDYNDFKGSNRPTSDFVKQQAISYIQANRSSGRLSGIIDKANNISKKAGFDLNGYVDHEIESITPKDKKEDTTNTSPAPDKPIIKITRDE